MSVVPQKKEQRIMWEFVTEDLEKGIVTVYSSELDEQKQISSEEWDKYEEVQ